MNTSSPSEYLRVEWQGRTRLSPASASQDAEWCEVNEDGSWQRIRFHDYAEIYRRQFLYEHLFCGLLRCRSPQRVVALLREVRADQGATEPLRAIDLGAGNGLVGGELTRLKPERVIGIDILPEARDAARRERPGVYDDYLVADLARCSPDVETQLRAVGANCLTCVAALGFGDIPARAYYNAVRFVERGGLIAFNIKEDFLDPRYTHGFSELIRRSQQEGMLRFEATRRYVHRVSTVGEPLHYTAIVATKLAEIPESLLVEPERPSADGAQRGQPRLQAS